MFKSENVGERRRVMMKAPGLFDVEERLPRLSDIGGQLEAYAAAVDFEIFRSDLDAALGYGDGAKGGRPPFDPMFGFASFVGLSVALPSLFKVLVIQAQNCPSSDNLGRLSVFQTGGSGSPLIDAMRFHFRGASAGRAWFFV